MVIFVVGLLTVCCRSVVGFDYCLFTFVTCFVISLVVCWWFAFCVLAVCLLLIYNSLNVCFCKFVVYCLLNVRLLIVKTLCFFFVCGCVGGFVLRFVCGFLTGFVDGLFVGCLCLFVFCWLFVWCWFCNLLAVCLHFVYNWLFACLLFVVCCELVWFGLFSFWCHYTVVSYNFIWCLFIVWLRFD